MRKLSIAVLTALTLNIAYSQVESTQITTTQVVSQEPSRVYPKFLNSHQIEVLEKADTIARKDDLKNPELLQGLLMQETKAGADANYKAAKNGCYGVLQIKLTTALHVLREFPELVEEFDVNVKNRRELVQRLINDDEFNISVGSKYIKLLVRAGFSTIKQLALAFNQGPGGAKFKKPETFPYVVSVINHIRKLLA